MERVDPSAYLKRGSDLEKLASEIEGRRLQVKNENPSEWMILY